MKILFYCGIHNLVNFNRIRPYYDVCYGFDANPEKVVRARNFYRNDADVHIVYGALMEKGGGEIEFTITKDWDPSSSLGNPNPQFPHMKSGLLMAQKKIKVPTINLYDFCRSSGIEEIDTLITDLQGIDLTVLKTMRDFITQGRIREIQSEVEPDYTPPIYLDIPPNKFSGFEQLLAEKYDVLWIDPDPRQTEGAWEMDVRWRVKGGLPSDYIEFFMEHELLVAQTGLGSTSASFSQYKEDLVVDALFTHKRKGCYVDVGAKDPDNPSKTRLFYNRGWRGINVEPESNLHAKLCAKRPGDINLNVGVGPEPGVMTFYRMSTDTLSSFKQEAAIEAGKLHGASQVSEVPVPVMRLTDILGEHLNGMKVDFLSVDAAGYDLDVLKSNDWSRYQPSVIMAKINVDGDDVVRFLQKKGYILIFNNGTNGIFLNSEFYDSLDDRVLEDLAILGRRHHLETFYPCPDGRENLVINLVYGHLQQEEPKTVHKGNVSIIWSAQPLEGCDVYLYHNAFSYQGKKGGVDYLLMLEPHVVLPGEFDQQVWKHFDHIFGPFDALVAQFDKFHKVMFPRMDITGINPVTDLQSLRESLYPLFGRKNGVCMISGNKSSHVPGELYSKRLEAAQWFSQNSRIPFDVYGNPPFALPNYRGTIPGGQKLDVLKQYRFSLCFENTNDPVLSVGYVTEKILDCLETRTIPIYSGASNIEQYIPSECFIDFRKFKKFKELDTYLRSISEKEYKEYIASIDTYVCSGGLSRFSEEALFDTVMQVLIDEHRLDARHFGKDIRWKTGIPGSLLKKEWKMSASPAMWTWRYLAKARPPIVHDGKITDRRQNDAGGPGHDAGIGTKQSIRVLVAGVKFSSGNARRGYDYCWWNMLDALNRFENIEVQFFDYATEAQQRGMAGMSERLEEIIRKEKPDMLLHVPGRLQVNIIPEYLESITRSTGTLTVMWLDESDPIFNADAGLWAPSVNHIITTSDASYDRCKEAGLAEKAIRSQWGFNPYTYDGKGASAGTGISFCGSSRGIRAEFLNRLRQSGLTVETFGSGWHEDSFIPFYDMVRIFGRSAINLNISDQPGLTDHQIARRIFEIPGCRGFLLTTPAPHLEEYYEPGREIVIASSPDEMIEKCRYYLSHESERLSIARRGYERTLAEHTWICRLTDIFDKLGFRAVPKDMPMTSSGASLAGKEVLQPAGPADEAIETSIMVMGYNKLHYTKQCIESILHYTKGPYELILSDNGSTDGTFEYFQFIRSIHPNTRIIKNFQNRNVEGFGNYAFSLGRGKYIAGVANDALVHEGWLENFIHHLESAPGIGIVGSRSNNISGPQIMQVDYDTMEAYQTFAAELSRQQKGSHFEIPRLVGIAALFKRATVERIGLTDPDLPINGRDGGYGFSDDDFTLRMMLGGYKSLVANDVLIHHFGSVTVKQHRPDLFGVSQNINKEKYFRKLRQNDRVTIKENGDLILKPYGPDEAIPVEDRMSARAPRICFMERGADLPGNDVPSRYAGVAGTFHGQLFRDGKKTLKALILEALASNDHDFLVLIDTRYSPVPEQIAALTDLSLHYPDIAVMVPVGSYAPETHNGSDASREVKIIPYADLSLAVFNLKLLRPVSSGLAKCADDDELSWFLQRRIRGEEYFIAKANDIVIDLEKPRTTHPFDKRSLPEHLITEKRYGKAVAVYEDDISKDPTFAEAYYQLAFIAREQQQTDEAVGFAGLALKADPHHILSLVLLSWIFIEQGDLDRAKEVVGQANLKQPGNPLVKKVVEAYEKNLLMDQFIRSGEEKFNQGNYREAVISFEKALKIDPQNTRAINNLGVVMWQTGDVPSAMKIFLNALSINPEDFDAFINLASSVRESGRYDLIEPAIVDRLRPFHGTTDEFMELERYLS